MSVCPAEEIEQEIQEVEEVYRYVDSFGSQVKMYYPGVEMSMY